jgi:cation:H+ antiporter
MNDYLAVILGVACAGAGGEIFVRGAVGLARWLRVAPGIIATTVMAFATSSPELSVAIRSAMAGKPQISLGDALGSNIVNVALILALALAIFGMRASPESSRRDFPVALLAPVLTGLLLLDGRLSRFDGLVMLAAFLVWISAVTVAARKQRSAAGALVGEIRPAIVLTACAAGLILLFVAGRFIVAGASGLAAAFGVDAFVVGATVVAIGTSVPELATLVVAGLRGHSEISLGTILGSNLFNVLFVIAVAAIIHPIPVATGEATVALLFGVAALALAFPGREGRIGRGRGAMLFLLYALYLGMLSGYAL